MISNSNLQPISDVQGSKSTRQIPLNKVGIRSIRHPIQVLMKTGITQTTVAELGLYVDLASHQRGTHMSRFVEMLNEEPLTLSCEQLPTFMNAMVVRLGATKGIFTAQFPYFIHKFAPVSNAASLMDYTVTLKGELLEGVCTTHLSVIVPVTSLCPCSKEISDYGAHNQRSHIHIQVETNSTVWSEDLIQLAEQEASCELYGILKRRDEKYVTERAYNNPKFVEDLVRDIACRLDNEPTISAYLVSSENFESIHNHSAYAEVQKRK